MKIERFQVAPGNCVVDRDSSCRMQFVFSWELLASAEVCIFRAGEERAIYCSPTEKAGRVSLELSVSETTRFDLALKQAPEKIASSSIRILAVGRQVRLKRRHLWSFL